MFPKITHPHSKLNDAQVSKGHLHLTEKLKLGLVLEMLNLIRLILYLRLEDRQMAVDG